MATKNRSAGVSGREARKVAYERVVATVKKQTGGSLGAMTSERNVRTVAVANGSLDVDEYEKALRAAIGNGDVFRWHGQLVAAEPDRIRAAIEAEATADHPRRGLIGQLNRILADLEGGGDE